MNKQALTSEQFLKGLIGAGFGNADPFLNLENDLGVRITTLLEDAGWVKSVQTKRSEGLNQYQTYISYAHECYNFSLTYRDEHEFAARGYNSLPPVAIKFLS
jgi:hypothetical protein